MNINSDEILKVLNGVFDSLSKQFGVAVDKLYPVILRQTKYSLIMDIVWSVICIAAIIACVAIVKWVHKNRKDDGELYYEDELSFALYIVSAAAFIISAVVLFVNIDQIIQILVNPDWFIYTEYIKPLITK